MPNNEPPLDDPAAFRKYLIGQFNYDPKWLDELLSPEVVVAEFPLVAASVKSLKAARHRRRDDHPRYISTGRNGGGRCYYPRWAILHWIERHTIDPQSGAA